MARNNEIEDGHNTAKPDPLLNDRSAVVESSRGPSSRKTSRLEQVYWLAGIAAAVITVAAALSSVDDHPVADTEADTAKTAPMSVFPESTVVELSRSACDPQAWAAAAAVFISENDLQTTWVDPDQDCLTTSHEVNRSGTPADNDDVDGDGVVDGVDPDQVPGGLIPSLAEQLSD